MKTLDRITITAYLEDLEKRIDPEVEEALWASWMGFLRGEEGQEAIFSPRRAAASRPARDWPRVPVNEALDDPERMVVQQLAACSAALGSGSGAILNVRANYGTGILPSLFGAAIFRMEDAHDTLPTTRPLEGGADAVRRLLDQEPPSLDTGFGAACLDMGRRFTALFKAYPRIAKYVPLYHPDLQGPMDACELLWGSGLFLDLVDEPGLVHAFLERITETYIRFLRAWEEIVPPPNGYAAHWGTLFKGRLMIRDDSAMNLSPAMFDEFIRPYDQRLLETFGGGAIHFCGRGDHYIDRLAGMPGVFAVYLSQPEYNAMERIFRHTIDRGIALVGLRREAAEEAVRRGRKLRGRVHCAT